ncbi:hypothetical protein [Parachitinimonas caeni]|uniref:Uncharacterized protein n=1 Tax=Parachitinimonas caeni TaxID=3031301 RepID=A0ABT7E3Z7_9NEIS|nr:hypothetical protein [Parachitinimonas caeni]MDK2127016.1 hypothetical protein [Parachitinimonas caeni]
MNKPEDLSTFSHKLHDEYGELNEVGIAFFGKYMSQMENFDFELFLDFQMRNFAHRYVLDLILSTSFLWQNLSPSTWVRILLRKNARPDTSRTNDQVAMFVDIEFLSRYVQVDALRFFMDSAANAADKLHAVSYFKKFSYGLVPSELDEDDLDGQYFVEKAQLSTLRELLCREHHFSPVTYTEGNINSYVNHLLGELAE